MRVFPHSEHHPSGNEKCCSLGTVHPPRKTRIGRGRPCRAASARGLLLRELAPWERRSPRVARHRELTTGPANLSSGRGAFAAGSTRVMKSGVQCSRIAAMTEANERHRLREEGVGALASPLGNARRCWRQGQRAANQRAPAISFVARRGELPQIPDRKGNWTGCSSARSISSRGSGGRLATHSGLARGLHAHSAVAVGVVSPRRAISCKWGARSRGCSRIRREIPSGRTGRIALSSECSYRFVVCMLRRHGIALLS